MPNDTFGMPPTLLTVRETAAYLHLSETAVRALCRAGRLSFHRMGVRGGRIRISQSSVELYLVETAAAPELPEETPRERHRQLSLRAPEGFKRLRAAGWRPKKQQ